MGPPAYTFKDACVCVDEVGILAWVSSQWPRLSTVQSARDLLMDRPLSQHDQLLTAQHQFDMATGETLCRGPEVVIPLTLSEMQDPFTRVLQSWSDFSIQFHNEALWAHPIVIYAHYSHSAPQLSVLAALPHHLRQLISDMIVNVMTTKIAIGQIDDEYIMQQYDRYKYTDVNCPYPINRIMRSWLKSQPGHNHRLICELSALMWMYYMSNPHTWGSYVNSCDDYKRSQAIASRAVYTAYTAFSHEYLRVYPQLMILISHTNTLEQIQMEHELFHEDFNMAWRWLLQAAKGDVSSVVANYQDRFVYGYSPVNGALVSVEDLAQAGCDIGYLKNSQHLALLINTARTPRVDALRAEELPSYTIEGVKYICSAPRMVSHEDQLRFQSGSHRTPPHLIHQRDPDSAYPQIDDIYARYRQMSLNGQIYPN